MRVEPWYGSNALQFPRMVQFTRMPTTRRSGHFSYAVTIPAMNKRNQNNESNVQHPRSGPQQTFWMRWVRFVGLLRIAHMVAEQQGGIRAGELNRKILEQNLYRTERGLPAKSTLYHCRNTLINLGVIERHQRMLTIASNIPSVKRLLSVPLAEQDSLPPAARQAFSDLVLQNPDCLHHFFGLFLASDIPVDSEHFADTAKPVIWTQQVRGRSSRVIELHSVARGNSAVLASPVAIRSILYGVRYWARDELQIIDEFFETGRGSVMYPVRVETYSHNADALVLQVLDVPADPGDWTTISVNSLLRLFCEERGYRVSTLFDALRNIIDRHSAHVALIPTIPNFAAISATSRHREEFELRGYYTDGRGRLISHIRFHNSLRGSEHAKKTRLS
jgi:hypothetical protein